jgi:hypothetical protein
LVDETLGEGDGVYIIDGSVSTFGKNGPSVFGLSGPKIG